MQLTLISPEDNDGASEVRLIRLIHSFFFLKYTNDNL